MDYFYFWHVFWSFLHSIATNSSQNSDRNHRWVFYHYFTDKILYIPCSIDLYAILSAIISGSLLAIFGQSSVKILRKRLWKQYLYLSVSTHSKLKTGEMVSRLTSDTSVLCEFLSVTFPQLIKSMILVCSTLVIIYKLNWKFSLILLLSLPLFFLFIFPLLSKLANIMDLAQQRMANLVGNISETLDNIYLIKINNTEENELQNGESLLNKLYEILLKGTLYEAMIMPIISTILLLEIFSILCYGLYQVSENEISIGLIISLLIYVTQMIFPVIEVGQLLGEISKVFGSLKKITYIFDEPIEKNDINTGLEMRNLGGLAFNSVKFSYPESNKLVIDGISFIANVGEITAIVGPSGSGKTTILSLIARLYSVTSGTIEYSGNAIYEYKLEDWRNTISYVTQKIMLFTGTFRENLMYGITKREIDNDQVSNVLKESKVNDFINNFEKGLDDYIGIRGSRLSGGQQQQLTIARSLLKNSRIVLFDEMTSALDSEKEKTFKNLIHKHAHDKIIIITAHRLSTIVGADKIIFLENGKITGIGKHDELLNDHEIYRNFIKNQII